MKSLFFGLLAVGLQCAFADDAATRPDAREAMRVCSTVGDAPPGERAAVAARGLALADRAIVADPSNPTAHLAAFCNLGKQMKLSANPFGNLFRLRRLKREADTTLALDPECADALVGKGLMLLQLPRLLGGDPHAAEALLRHGLARNPDHFEGRIALAEQLQKRDPEAALIEARRALATAERDGDADDIEEARTLLGTLGEDGMVAARERPRSPQGPIDPSK